jgi:NPCBM/NEW2 domain-containing protein
MTFSLAALLAIAIAGADSSGVTATVKPLAGEAMTARLVQLNSQNVVLETQDGQKKLAASDVLAIEFPREKSASKPAVWLELLDGSKLLAAGYTAAAGKATVELLGGTKVEIPTRSINSVRFRQQDSSIAQQWREIVTAQHTTDLIIVRKTSTRIVEEGDAEPKTVTETALDELDGTFLEVGAENVKFEFEGSPIDFKREKIEGLIYFHAANRKFPNAICRLVDASGSQWSLQSVELSGDQFSVVSAAGVAAKVPLADVAKIDFSVGNVANLVELEPDTGDAEPVVSLQPAAMTAKFGRMFKISRSPPLGAEGFRIGGQRFESGLSLHSPASLVYRVPEGFRQFHATAGVDDTVVAPGHFVFQILGDGRELFRHEFNASASRGPVPIHLDLSGVRRITLVVDPADGQDIGDQLNLCEARLTK